MGGKSLLSLETPGEKEEKSGPCAWPWATQRISKHLPRTEHSMNESCVVVIVKTVWIAQQVLSEYKLPLSLMLSLFSPSLLLPPLVLDPAGE